jgi:hypothetical protein
MTGDAIYVLLVAKRIWGPWGNEDLFVALFFRCLIVSPAYITEMLRCSDPLTGDDEEDKERLACRAQWMKGSLAFFFVVLACILSANYNT